MVPGTRQIKVPIYRMFFNAKKKEGKIIARIFAGAQTKILNKALILCHPLSKKIPELEADHKGIPLAGNSLPGSSLLF